MARQLWAGSGVGPAIATATNSLGLAAVAWPRLARQLPPAVHDVGVDAVRHRHLGYRGTRGVALGQHLRLEFIAVPPPPHHLVACHRVHLGLRGHDPSRSRGSIQDGFAGRILTSRKSRMRASRTHGPVRAKAEWLSYSTNAVEADARQHPDLSHDESPANWPCSPLHCRAANAIRSPMRLSLLARGLFLVLLGVGFIQAWTLLLLPLLWNILRTGRR